MFVVQIGGGFQDHDLSDITVTWMAVRGDPLILVDLDMISVSRQIYKT